MRDIKKYIASPKSIKNITKIPAGIFSFDALTGGGIPRGKITIFEGAKSSGKTTVSLKIIGNYLRNNKGQVLYIDLEDSFDMEWAELFINKSDIDRILLVNNITYAEELIDIIVEILKSEDFSIEFLFLDSIANLIPIADADKSAMEDTVGMLARTLNKFFRKVLPIKANYRTQGKDLTMLLINQLRSKIGAPAFSSNMTKPGGHYQDFLAHLDVRFYRIGIDNVEGLPIKSKHQFKIEKSKVKGALAGAKGEFTIFMKDHNGIKRGHSRDYELIINTAKKINFLIREGNKWHWLGETFKSQADIVERMKEDKKFYTRAYLETIKKMGE